MEIGVVNMNVKTRDRTRRRANHRKVKPIARLPVSPGKDGRY
jgi:hypothetical protein